MKRRLLILLAVVATAVISVQAETKKYQINVAGVEVTSDNASYITGGDITSGYGVYNESTNTLTLYNMHIYRTSQDKYGIHNRECNNLTIVFNGSCNVTTSDNALKLERSTTLNAAAGSQVSFYSAARICANLKSYNYYIKGSGTMAFDTDQSGYEAIKGEGTGSTKVYFQGAKVTASSKQRSALSSFAAYFESGADLTVAGNGSNVSVSGVSMTFYGREALLSPYGAYYSSSSIYNSSGSQVTSGSIYISDNYVAILNSSYFPDANFRNALYNILKKSYINQDDVNSRTSLSLRDKSINSLTGLGYFTKLTSLDCYKNSLTSLPSLPSTLQELNLANNKFTSLNITGMMNLKTLDVSGCSSLTTLNCYNNALTSLDVTDCSSLSNLYCQNNKLTTLGALPRFLRDVNLANNNFTSLTITNKPVLKQLNVSNCKSLTLLDCNSNALTSLDVSGCTSMTRLSCFFNEFTSLPTLPNSLQDLYCGHNNFTSLTVTGKTNLKLLNVDECASLTQLNCYGNALTKLSMLNCSSLSQLNCSDNALATFTVQGCTALAKLNCSNNQFTSLPTLPSSLQELYCANNMFTFLTITNKPNLKVLNVNNCNTLDRLDCNDNALTSLSLSGCPALTNVNCNNNQLAALPTLPSALVLLYCNNNKLTSLPTLPSGLQQLECQKNEFTSLTIRYLKKLFTLKIGNNPKLTTLNCNDNVLTTLTLEGNTALATLDCSTNKLSSLDLQGLSALQRLECQYNSLSALNVSSLSNLTYLHCGTNYLKSLDVSSNSKLNYLACNGNQLTSLNVQGCAALATVYCGKNKLTSLSFEGCNALNLVNLVENFIKDSEMTSLVRSLRMLPAGSNGTLQVRNTKTLDSNEFSDAHVRAARAKRWIPYEYSASGTWQEITPSAMRGDLNGDGAVDVDDMNIVINIMVRKGATFEQYPAADLDDSGVVDIDDLNIIINIMVNKE